MTPQARLMEIEKIILNFREQLTRISSEAYLVSIHDTIHALESERKGILLGLSALDEVEKKINDFLDYIAGEVCGCKVDDDVIIPCTYHALLGSFKEVFEEARGLK